ncbi:MAG: hypothetical protein M3167_06150 [Acidobacteriota bacterium]|nr:hypothetical protein [Acidobacteriota bacterium]MDQ6892246.1 hypothetical protein [Acidobacteriota bacterium]
MNSYVDPGRARRLIERDQKAIRRMKREQAADLAKAQANAATVELVRWCVTCQRPECPEHPWTPTPANIRALPAEILSWRDGLRGAIVTYDLSDMTGHEVAAVILAADRCAELLGSQWNPFPDGKVAPEIARLRETVLALRKKREQEIEGSADASV